MIIRNSSTTGIIDGVNTIATDEVVSSDARIASLEYDIAHLTLASDLLDVNTTGVVNGSILKYDTATSKWIIGTDSDTTPALGDLTDVDVTGVTDGQLLAYNNTSGNWEPTDAGTAAVDSVNGQTGIVVLDTDDISEGATNLYYTDARVQAVSINELVEDTTPQLGGNLDTTGYSLVSSTGVGLIRNTTGDNNSAVVIAKSTAGTSESLLLKSLLSFRSLNSTSDYAIAHIFAERLSNTTVQRQLTMGLYDDAGAARTEFLRMNRTGAGVDTVDVLKDMNAGALTASGVVNINNTLNATGNVNFTGGTIDLHASLAATLESDVDVNITAGTTANINVTGKKIVTSATIEANVDMSSIPNAFLINSQVPVTKDIVNHMSGYSDYTTSGLPTQIQNTYTFGVKQTGTANPDYITGRLVATYEDSTGTTMMQMRSYDVGTNNHYDLAVSQAKAYSTVPFQFPSFTTTERDAMSPAAGWVLFNTTDTKLQVYTGSAWADLH